MDEEVIKRACALLDAADAPTTSKAVFIHGVGYKTFYTLRPLYRSGDIHMVGAPCKKVCYLVDCSRFVYTRDSNGDIVVVDPLSNTFDEAM